MPKEVSLGEKTEFTDWSILARCNVQDISIVDFLDAVVRDHIKSPVLMLYTLGQ